MSQLVVIVYIINAHDAIGRAGTQSAPDILRVPEPRFPICVSCVVLAD